MKNRNFLQSLNAAVEGFIYVLKEERNMRIHFLGAFLVLLLAVFLNVRRLDWIILCSAIMFVLVMEMMNTAIERTTDLIKDSFHPAVRFIKDVAAGAVLLSAINALVVAFFVFSKYVSWPIEVVVNRTRNTPWHVTFAALWIVIFFVIAGKAFLKRGTPFRGGMPSGHSATAFVIFTAVLFTTDNPFAIGATFLLALLVAQSRLRAKIHSYWEVTIGALLGFLTTALFFQIFQR